MRKHYKTWLNSIFFALTISAAVSCSGGDEEEKQISATETKPAAAFQFPALKERTGEMAKTEEWAKTKEKVNEYMQKLQKNPAKPNIFKMS